MGLKDAFVQDTEVGNRLQCGRGVRRKGVPLAVRVRLERDQSPRRRVCEQGTGCSDEGRRQVGIAIGK